MRRIGRLTSPTTVSHFTYSEAFADQYPLSPKLGQPFGHRTKRAMKEQHRGLWSDPYPVEPWLYRRAAKQIK